MLKSSLGVFTGVVISLISPSASGQQIVQSPAPQTSMGPSTPSFPSSSYPPSGRPPTSYSLPFQVGPGSQFAQSKYYQNAYQQVQQFSRCLAHIGPRRAQSLLNSAPNTAKERIAYRSLLIMGRSCLPYGYSAPTAFLRGGLAEAMYRQVGAGNMTVDHKLTADQISRFYSAEAARSDARLVDDRKITELANCLVVGAPDSIRPLLLSKHGSSNERVELQSVIDRAPYCASNRKLSSTASTTFIRAYIAESAYRLSELDG